MDPNQTWSNFLSAQKAIALAGSDVNARYEAIGEAFEAADCMIEWLQSGGFPPIGWTRSEVLRSIEVWRIMTVLLLQTEV